MKQQRRRRSLPPNVFTLLKTLGTVAHQTGMSSVRGNQASAGNLLRHSAVRQVDEMGPAAAGATAKILAMPKGPGKTGSGSNE